jgi:hypothetical protein
MRRGMVSILDNSKDVTVYVLFENISGTRSGEKADPCRTDKQ